METVDPRSGKKGQNMVGRLLKIGDQCLSVATALITASEAPIDRSKDAIMGNLEATPERYVCSSGMSPLLSILGMTCKSGRWSAWSPGMIPKANLSASSVGIHSRSFFLGDGGEYESS